MKETFSSRKIGFENTINLATASRVGKAEFFCNYRAGQLEILRFFRRLLLHRKGNLIPWKGKRSRNKGRMNSGTKDYTHNHKTA